jgi:hypothetical protein
VQNGVLGKDVYSVFSLVSVCVCCDTDVFCSGCHLIQLWCGTGRQRIFCTPGLTWCPRNYWIWRWDYPLVSVLRAYHINVEVPMFWTGCITCMSADCHCFNAFQSNMSYVAGCRDSAVGARTDLYDVLVNLPAREITVATHAKGNKVAAILCLINVKKPLRQIVA